jgi:membrane protein DedA with SNARE-associated domain
MLVASLTHSITSFVGNHGVLAVFVLMLIDAVFPAASELVMVYGGALASGAIGAQHVGVLGTTVSSHATAYVVIALAGTLGYVAGSLLGWAIGAWFGRPFVERHARLFHLDQERLARIDAWFARYGARAVLLGRITPVVRSFVSIPAGAQRMPLAPYTLYTLLGSALWCFALAAVGWAVGTSYERFNRAFDVLSVLVVLALAGLAAAFVVRGRRRAAA